MAYFAGGGDEILAVITRELQKIVSWEQIPALFRVPKRLYIKR
jgi:hypothetical protein